MVIKSIQKTVYVTTDGKEFDCPDKAETHEQKYALSLVLRDRGCNDYEIGAVLNLFCELKEFFEEK